MRKSVLIALATVAAVTAVAALTKTRWSPATPRVDPSIDALDRCIQARFESMPDFQFGPGRLLSIPYHVRQFDAETREERAAVAELNRRGWEVAVMVGGRRLLEAETMTQANWESAPLGFRRHTLSEPIAVTSASNVSELPQPWEVWEHGRRAFRWRSSRPKVTSVRDWSVHVRPVPVYQEGCLKCHGGSGAGLKVGDTLGVAIYLYRPTPPAHALPYPAVLP
jgi:hypothetical protein